MTTLHHLDPCISRINDLTGLLARRRVVMTTGDAAAARGAAVLVAATPDATAERCAQDAARSAGIRQVVMLREDAAAFEIETEQGGRILRISLPAPAAGGALRDPALLLLADILAAQLRPMVACDAATGALVDLAGRVARSDVTVFINGPTGSGKEVLARAIHADSPRAKGAFVAINCAAIPENMLEAILFGHEKGAFTGAAVANRGLIRAADGGTLLLDEVSEMPLGLQAKLLRVLQERSVTPLGASVEVAVDIRIIATSNRDMRAEVAANRFREDLYYRLHVFPLMTRPLALRRDDIAALAVALLRRHWAAGTPPLFTADALAALCRHDWPGNVRELDNVVQRALVLCDGRTITAADIVLDTSAGMVLPDTARAPVQLARVV